MNVTACDHRVSLSAKESRKTSSREIGHLEYFGDGAPPETLVIACSDPPTDDGFVSLLRSKPVLLWRSPAEAVAPHGAGNADFEKVLHQAVIDAGVEEVIVCGHLGCSALQRAAGEPERAALEPPLLYTSAAAHVVCEKYGDLPPDRYHQALVEENTLVQMRHLRTYPRLLAAIASGKLTLHGWVYDDHTGEIHKLGHRSCKLLRRLQPAAAAAGFRPRPCLDPAQIYLA